MGGDKNRILLKQNVEYDPKDLEAKLPDFLGLKHIAPVSLLNFVKCSHTNIVV